MSSKAVTPSEEARSFLETIMRVADNWVINPETLEESHVKAAALIQARDERIRRETLEKIASVRHEDVFSAEADWAYDRACKDIVSLLTPEATNGQ